MESWAPFIGTLVVLALVLLVLKLLWLLVRKTLFRNWRTGLLTVATAGLVAFATGAVSLSSLQTAAASEETAEAAQFWGPVVFPLLFIGMIFGLLIFAKVLRGVFRQTLFRNWWSSVLTVVGFALAMAAGGPVRGIVGAIFALSLFDVFFDLFVGDGEDGPRGGAEDYGETPEQRYWRTRAEEQSGRPLPMGGDYGPGSGWT